jgi:hypothetical protein
VNTWLGASACVPQCALIEKHVEPHGAAVPGLEISRQLNPTSPGQTGVSSEMRRETS